MATLGFLEGRGQHVDLVLAPDEAAEPAGTGRLQAGLRELRAEEFEDLDRAAQAFDVDLFDRSDLDVALQQPLRIAGDHDATRRRQLLHTGRQVGRLANGRIVHVEVVADRADQHLSELSPTRISIEISSERRTSPA